MKKLLVAFALLAGIGGGGAYLWRQHELSRAPVVIVSANGRIEAQQIDLATKIAGRLAEIGPHEGDMVEAGALVARLDDTELKAQLARAAADAARARQAVAQADAEIVSRDSQLRFAKQEVERTQTLTQRGVAPLERLDDRQNQVRVAEAALRAAQAGRDAALAAVDSAEASRTAVQSQLDDTRIFAPRRGRIEYRLVQPGEVVGAGSRLLTLLDLTDVYMTIFLPAGQAGRLSVGDEARIILDPAPQWVIPAKVSFVASEAQFTPKTVETREEREKLMFRVKLTLPPDLLARYENRVKAGVRGLGHVRLSPDTPWPPELVVHLP